MSIRKITKKEAEKMIAEIDSNDDSKLGVIKLGRFYYDVTDSNSEAVAQFIFDSEKRQIEKATGKIPSKYW